MEITLPAFPTCFSTSKTLKSIGVFLFVVLLGDHCHAQTSDESAQVVDGYETLEWTDLMPEEDLEAVMNPPEYLNNIDDGSAADQIDGQLKSNLDNPADNPYEQALVSTKVVPELDSKAVRLPGFIVPLEFDEDGYHVTKFFLVPYFGACIHMPPPPPNQIVFAEYDESFKLGSLYDPFWISGILSTTLVENETATAAYSMTVERMVPYTE